jgi:SAM-dependent methyltransferase
MVDIFILGFKEMLIANDFLCKVCAEGCLEILDEYHFLPRVTSDSKPWPAGGQLSVCQSCGTIQKLPDETWQQEASQIYRQYEIYHLTNGAEQLVFAESGAEPRSQRLVNFVVSHVRLPISASLIDIGCGNGEALANFSSALPEWKLYGSELRLDALPRLRKLRNFKELYTVPPGRIPGRFSFVAMIHSLEHMPDPLAMLNDVRDLLDEKGILFVQVPDAENSPFDFLVVDHLVHFTRSSLIALVSRAGVLPEVLVNDVVPKELTFLGSRHSRSAATIDPNDGIQTARKAVQWLAGVFAQVQSLAKCGPIGVFGTSIAGMAVYGSVRNQVSFFVDEDPSRIGNFFDGKPILPPSAIPANHPVFVAFPTNKAVSLATRLSASTKAQFVIPAPI